MSCDTCWTAPRRKTKKHSFLVVMVDAVTNREGQCIVQSKCGHGMQEHVSKLSSLGLLSVVDPAHPDVLFDMDNPVVTHVDAKIAAHIPIKDSDLIL